MNWIMSKLRVLIHVHFAYCYLFAPAKPYTVLILKHAPCFPVTQLSEKQQAEQACRGVERKEYNLNACPITEVCGKIQDGNVSIYIKAVYTELSVLFTA